MGSAVCVLPRRGESGGSLLQAVVADGVGSFDGRLDVAGLDELELLLAVVPPDSGEIAGL